MSAESGYTDVQLEALAHGVSTMSLAELNQLMQHIVCYEEAAIGERQKTFARHLSGLVGFECSVRMDEAGLEAVAT